MTSKKIKSGFTTVHVVTDDKGRDSIPVGVAAWDSVEDWYAIRFPQEDEEINGLTQTKRRLVELARQQLAKWSEKGEIPYSARSRRPSETEFWVGVQDALTAGIRLDSPKPIDAEGVSRDEVHALFEAIVQPRIEKDKRQQRIDRMVGEALGGLSESIKGRHEVPAFGGVDQSVMRGASGSRGHVVVEGVNLAGLHATRDADAVVSKLLRIMSAEGAGRVKAIVGYRASPNGLNGESHMRDWISAKATGHVYDLTRERGEFEQAARQALDQIGPVDTEQDGPQNSLDFP